MAKVEGPLFSLSASGAIGKSLVYASRLGKNIVRGFSIPSNPQSNDQAEVRTKLAIPGKCAKAVVQPSAFYSAALLVVSAGQTWNSQIAKEMLGTDLGNFDADTVEYAALDAGEKTLWTTAAGTTTLVDYDLGYGAYGAVTKGEQLFHLAKAAYRLGMSVATTDPEGWIEATINTFAGDVIAP